MVSGWLLGFSEATEKVIKDIYDQLLISYFLEFKICHCLNKDMTYIKHSELLQAIIQASYLDLYKKD